MNKKVLAALTAGLITFAPFTATNAAPAQDRESIYQVALLQSLTMGYFDGTITVKELKSHGDIGIGTFEGLDGELICLDGVVYRANRDCNINVMRDNDKIPFSNVTFFDKDFSVKLNNVGDKIALEKIFNEQVDKTDAFNMNVPKKNNFHTLNFNQDLKEDIRKAEQDSVKSN